MPTEGLLFVISKPKEDKLSDSKFNEYYDREHLPEVLARNLTPVALRYKNADSKANNAYLAVYPFSDTATLSSDNTAKWVEDTRQSKLLGGEIYDYIDFNPRIYELIQRFENQGFESSTGKDRGKTIVAVAMDPGEGNDADFDDWYRKEHLDMLSTCRGYRRCTRYRLIGEGHLPYLAIHEYDCAAKDVPDEQVKHVVGTEWSKQILKNCKAAERDVFELIEAQGDVTVKL